MGINVSILSKLFVITLSWEDYEHFKSQESEISTKPVGIILYAIDCFFRLVSLKYCTCIGMARCLLLGVLLLFTVRPETVHRYNIEAVVQSVNATTALPGQP